METNVKIRTLHPRQASFVTVVQQRMSVFDVELEPVAGVAVEKELEVIGGVMLFRAWIFHAGVGAGYSVDERIRVDVPVAIEVRPNLMVGALVMKKRAFLAYQF